MKNLTNEELLKRYVEEIAGAKIACRAEILRRMLPSGPDVVINRLTTVRKGTLAGELRGEDIEKVLEALEFEFEEDDGYHVAEDKYIYLIEDGYELDGTAWGDYQGVVIPSKAAFRDVFASPSEVGQSGAVQQPIASKPFSRLLLSVDASASNTGFEPLMKSTIMAISALVQEAKVKGMQVGVELFANRQKIWENVESSPTFLEELPEEMMMLGGGNSVPGLEIAAGAGQGDLVMYMTDFQLYNRDRDAARQTAHAAIEAGACVVPVAMHEHHDMKDIGMEFVECLDYRDAEKIAVAAFRKACSEKISA